MSADCIPRTTLTSIVDTIFDEIDMGKVMLNAGDESTDHVMEIMDEARDVLYDWIDNL